MQAGRPGSNVLNQEDRGSPTPGPGPQQPLGSHLPARTGIPEHFSPGAAPVAHLCAPGHRARCPSPHLLSASVKPAGLWPLFGLEPEGTSPTETWNQSQPTVPSTKGAILLSEGDHIHPPETSRGARNVFGGDQRNQLAFQPWLDWGRMVSLHSSRATPLHLPPSVPPFLFTSSHRWEHRGLGELDREPCSLYPPKSFENVP